MAFRKAGSLNPHGAPVLKRHFIKNSVTTVVMDSLKLGANGLEAGTAGALVFGHVLAHATKLGLGLNTTGAAGAAIGSYVGSFAAASDNQTVAQVQAECDVSKFTLYAAEESAAIGTTTGSNLPGYKQDLTDANTLDESTAALTTAQYNGWGVDQDDSSMAVVNIYESQVFGV